MLLEPDLPKKELVIGLEVTQSFEGSLNDKLALRNLQQRQKTKQTFSL